LAATVKFAIQKIKKISAGDNPYGFKEIAEKMAEIPVGNRL
jgi:hypothetical protein